MSAAKKKPKAEQRPTTSTRERESDREAILDEIDDAIGPEQMSAQDALDWLQEFKSSIDARIFALREDIDR